MVWGARPEIRPVIGRQQPAIAFNCEAWPKTSCRRKARRHPVTKTGPPCDDTLAATANTAGLLLHGRTAPPMKASTAPVSLPTRKAAPLFVALPAGLNFYAVALLPADPLQPGRLKGRLEHVLSGRRHDFDNASGLLACLACEQQPGLVEVPVLRAGAGQLPRREPHGAM